MSKLQDILHIETKDKGTKVLKLIDVNEAEAAIKQWVRDEIIGKDDEVNERMTLSILDENMQPREVFSPDKTRNRLRKLQRRKLDE